MKLRSAAISLLFTTTVSLQSIAGAPPAAAQAPAATTRTLTGHVKDARSGQPVPDVEIKSNTTPPHRAITATDGSFTLTGLAAGATTVELEATRIGFTTQKITVNLADTTATADISLEPRAIPEPQVEVTTSRATERGSAVA